MSPNGATLAVPGATLYYKRQGSGPLLMILQGGAGDADSSDPWAAHLAANFTVLTYDRRGLSRSQPDSASESPEVTTHSEDVSHLIAALASEPVYVFGTSIGAVIGLDLVLRHPGQVRLLVAHEPPLAVVFPAEDRARIDAEQQEIEELYQREGAAAALMKLAGHAGVNLTDREPGVVLSRPTPQHVANTEFFMAHDFGAVRRYQPALTALRGAAAKIIPAYGAFSRNAWPNECALRLAAVLERAAVEFPGAHAGQMTHPKSFAARLINLLPPAA